jgi:hypothetical protein
MSKLNAALDLARRGFRVFPLGDDCKPEIERWPEKATTDEAQIRAWWIDPVMDWELDRNIGIACGRGLQVVDLDQKKGRQGCANFASLEDLKGEPIPPTFTVRTPTKGIHKFVAVEDQYRNSAGEIAEGVDTRGDGGFVVGPGSVRHDGVYEIVDDLPVAAAPKWLLSYLKPFEPPAARSEIHADLDSPYAVVRAVEMLQTAAPVGEAGIGNNETFKMAAKVKDLGVSRDTAIMLLEQFWNSRSEFARSMEELKDIANNAYRHGRSAVGTADPALQFEPVAETGSRRITYVRSDKIKIGKVKDPLVEDLLRPGGMSMFYGPSGAGKSFLLFDLGDCVSRGRPWRGKQVKQGLVIYCAIEGAEFAPYRIKALHDRYGAADTAFALITSPINLHKSPKDYSELMEAIRAAEADYGQRCVLLIIDTVSRALAGGDENSPDAMGSLVHNLDRLRAETGIAIALSHHSGKDATKGARGHSLLRAAVDTEVEIADKMFTVTKQRDMKEEPAFPFVLNSVEVGEYESGAPVLTCTVDYPTQGRGALDRDQQELKDAMLSFDQAAADAALGLYGHGFTQDQLLSTPVDTSVWVTNFAFRRGLKCGVGVPQRDSHAYKRLKAVSVKCGGERWVRRINTRQWVKGNVEVPF